MTRCHQPLERSFIRLAWSHRTEQVTGWSKETFNSRFRSQVLGLGLAANLQRPRQVRRCLAKAHRQPGDQTQMAEVHASGQQATTHSPARFSATPTRSLNVKRVPESVWRHARVNAHMSGATFRDFIIFLMATSKPVRPIPLDSNSDAAENQ